MDALPFPVDRERLLVDVRLTPRGGRDPFEGAERLTDGRPVLKAQLRALPEDGKAHVALEGLLARELGIARSHVAVVQGKTGRVKTLSVAGDLVRLSASLARLAAAVLVLLVAFAGAPASAQFMARGDICADPSQFQRSRAAVERAGLQTPDRARLVRTLRAAQSLARDACPNRDGWLVRRAVGMVNAVNREVRLPPVDLPLFLRE